MKCPFCESGSITGCDNCDIPRWVSVMDELPETYKDEKKRVLGWTRTDSGINSVWRGCVDVYFQRNMGWRSCLDHLPVFITHWMRLPKEPND